MKVVITTQGPDLDSQVDPRFGRAQYFLLVDTETGECSTHDNTQNLNAVQGAGIQAGRSVVDLGAEAVITGNVGPKAFMTLQAANVKIFTQAAGTAKQAIEQLKAGQLQATDRANVQGHWM